MIGFLMFCMFVGAIVFTIVIARLFHELSNTKDALRHCVKDLGRAIHEGKCRIDTLEKQLSKTGFQPMQQKNPEEPHGILPIDLDIIESEDDLHLNASPDNVDQQPMIIAERVEQNVVPQHSTESIIPPHSEKTFHPAYSTLSDALRKAKDRSRTEEPELPLPSFADSPEESGFRSGFSSGVRTPKPGRPPVIDPDSVPQIPTAKTEKEILLNAEMLIGSKALGWVAALLFVLFAALVLRYSVIHGLISPPFRIAGLGVFGSCFLIAGGYYFRIGWKRFASMLNSSGTIILFLTGYASYALYELVSIEQAMGILTVLVVGAFVLAFLYDSVLLGTFAIIGGLAVPVLLESSVDRYELFFTYLFLLNFGTLLLLNLMRRVPLGLLVMLGTQIEFALWYDRYFEQEKLFAVLFFQGAFYAIYWIDTTLGTFSKRFHTTWDDTVRAILAPVILFFWLFIFFRESDPSGDLLGRFAFVAALWYALLNSVYLGFVRGNGLLGFLRNRDPEAGSPVGASIMIPVTSVISLAFVATGIPLCFGAEWISLGWIVIASLLWAVGNRIESTSFRWMSGLFFILGLGRLAALDLPWRHTEPIIPVLNLYALPPLAAAIAALLAAAVAGFSLRSKNKRLGPDDVPWWKVEFCCNSPMGFRETANCGFAFFGISLLTLVLSVECFWGFHDSSLANGCLIAIWSLSVLWLLLGSLALAAGIILRAPFARTCGFVLLTMAALKVCIIDLASRFIFTPWEQWDSYHGFCIEWRSPPPPLFTPLWNEYAIPIMIVAFGLVCWGIFAAKYRKKMLRNEEAACGPIFAVFGLVQLWAVLSVECAMYFKLRPDTIPFNEYHAHSSLSILWTAYALILTVIGFACSSRFARGFGVFVGVAAACKILLIEMFRGSIIVPYTVPFANSFAAPILIVIMTLMLGAIIATRIVPLESHRERGVFVFAGQLGLLLLWLLLSVECYHYFNVTFELEGMSLESIKVHLTLNSLTLIWMIMALLLYLIGCAADSRPLRCFVLVMCGAILLKIAAFDLLNRPNFLQPHWAEYYLPVLNTYFMPPVFAALTLIIFAVNSSYNAKTQEQSDETTADTVERAFFKIFGFLGMLLLLVSSSIECFQTVRMREIETMLGIQTAQLALSILWAIFGGGLMFVGFVFRSAILRWTALALFLLTILKVLTVDLASLESIYKFAAVFALAVVLGLAARAYQRFKPE